MLDTQLKTLVITAQLAGVSNETTAFGATLFVWARMAYAGIYIAGIPYLRTVAFVVSLRGMFSIARELFAVWSVAPPV